METDTSYLLAEAIGAGVLWIVYSIMVLFLVKVQKMNVGFIGVLVSCFLGIIVTLVPVVGIYLSFPVTVFCLWRFAGTHAFGDAIFTVVISGALMFCFKLFVLASLLGNISSAFGGFLPELEQEVQAAELEEAELADTATEVAAPEPVSSFDWSIVDERAFKLKGINYGTGKALIMFQYDGLMYTLEEGESCAVQTDGGTFRVRCEKVHRSDVDLLLNDEKSFKLSVH